MTSHDHGRGHTGAHTDMLAPSIDTGSQTRVVIADDTADMRLLLRALLDHCDGLSVVAEAENGVEAVELAQRHQPEVVLLDLEMPVMNGLEALPLLRRAAPACIVIVVSSFRADLMADRAMAAGATSYVEKFAAPTDLVPAIEAGTGRSYAC